MTIDEAKMETWFTYHPIRPDQTLVYETIRHAAKQFAEVVLNHTPPSSDQSDAIRKIREAVYSAHASISCAGR